MCGRYSLTRRDEEVLERFSIQELLFELANLQPRYNIAPSQMVPVVLNIGGRRVLDERKWGLISHWSTDLKATAPMIQARGESVAEKPFFKKSFETKHCLIPADGFYEWKRENKDRIPMYIKVNDQQIFSFAGLWDEWTSPQGDVIRSCAIITTAANSAIAAVHHRMPVIVAPYNEEIWLNHECRDTNVLQNVLQSYDASAIEMHEVSSQVNSANNDFAELIAPVPSQPKIWDLMGGR